MKDHFRVPHGWQQALFESMHDTKSIPARIAVGSFTSGKFRPYPSTCVEIDRLLHSNEYQGDLYVVSAGNFGYDEDRKKSQMETVGNPGSCKNTLTGESRNEICEKILS